MIDWILPILAIIANVFIAWLSHRDTKNQIKDQREKTALENKGLKQDLADKAVEANIEIFDHWQTERKVYEDTLKRVNNDLIRIQKDSSTDRELGVQSIRMASDARFAAERDAEKYKKAWEDQLVINATLREVEKRVDEHDISLKHVTDQLPPRDDLQNR